MKISKNQKRKMTRYSDSERYYRYLLDLFDKSKAMETKLIKKGADDLEVRKVWTSFYNQVDYSLLRNDRHLTTEFIDFVREYEFKYGQNFSASLQEKKALSEERAQQVFIEIQEFIKKLQRINY